MDYREYWNEVDRIAAELSEDPDALEEAYGTDEVSEVLMQIVDGHEFVIYYAKALKVLEYTDNEDAYFELYNAPPQVDSFKAMLAPLAYYAFETDIMERMGRENPTRARSRGYGRRARENFSEPQHRDLYENWSQATRAWGSAARAAFAAGDRKAYEEMLGSMSYSEGRKDANMAGMEDAYDRAQAGARRYTYEGEDEAQYFLEQQRPGRSNPPGKWRRQELTSGGNSPGYLLRGVAGQAAWIIAYKPRKYEYARNRAAEYEALRGQKVPKGTKWLLSTFSAGDRHADVRAHKTLKAAKAAGAKAIGAPNPRKRKKAKRNAPAAKFKAQLKTSSRAKAKRVGLPKSAKAHKVGGKVVHRSVSNAGGKLRLIQGWTVSMPSGVGVAKFKTKAAAERHARGS